MVRITGPPPTGEDLDSCVAMVGVGTVVGDRTARRHPRWKVAHEG